MTSNLHQVCLSIALLVSLPLLASETADQTAEDWAALLEDAESSADWAADPLADLNLFGEASSTFLLTAALRAGAGYSDNFLKRPGAVDSPFYRVEADVYLSWFLEKSTLSALLYAESNFYTYDVEADNEFLTFTQFTWSRSGPDSETGLEVVNLFADQIYDASLSPTGEASGTRIRLLRPEAMIYRDWFPARRTRLRLDLAGGRAEYNIENEDYWEPILGLEWEQLWRKGLRIVSRIEVSRQFYDDATGREANGLDSPNAKDLRVDRLMLEESLKWQPSSLDWLELAGTAGLAWENDLAGSYESLRQGWVSGRITFKGKWGQLKLNGRWREIRYDERQVDFLDPTPVLHTQRSISSEYKVPLPWALAVYLRYEWTRLDSRVAESRYKEQRGEFLFQWSY